MGVGDFVTTNFNKRLAFSVTLVAISAANYGFDNQGFSAAQAMQPFAKQFGVYDSSKDQYELQAYWLSLYSSVVWAGFAVGELVKVEPSRWVTNTDNLEQVSSPEVP